MKLICVENNFSAYNKFAGFTSAHTETPAFYVLPDTSLLKDSRPFFVPNFAMPCSIGLQLAIRISRLGRSIGSRFANRYYDATTVAATFTARKHFDRLREQGLPWTEAKAFEGSIAIGTWQPLEVFPQKLFLNIGEHNIIEGVIADMLYPIDNIIFHISRIMTLRQGDILLLGSMNKEFFIQPDTHISGTMDNTEVLHFNIK